MTIVITYYECPKMLIQQIKYWIDYPDDLGYKLRIVIVDDGSPNYPAENILNKEKVYNWGIPVNLYRIQEDHHNNVGGARNLGFEKANDGWVFNLDIDHVVPANSLVNLMRAQLDSKYYYLPRRYEVGSFGLKSIHRHLDSFIIQRQAFWDLGGYDERYAKYYYQGACSMLRNKMKKLPSIETDDIWTLWYSSKLIPDASPTSLKEKITNGEISREEKTLLNFKYEQVI